MVRLLVVCVVAAVSAGAGEHPAGAWNPRLYRCPLASTAPVVDGRLDDAAWSRAPWTEDFVDIEGDARPVAPRYRTRARLVWDHRALYVAAELADPHVWGSLTTRDAVIFEDNDFEVFIDPDGDNHLYAELEINALGTVWDLVLVRPYRDGGPALSGWDIAGLESAVEIDGTANDPRDADRGWTVEIALPWTALAELAGDRSCPPAAGDTWRLNFSRVEWEHRLASGAYVKAPVPGRGWRGEDNWVWSPQGVVAMHAPERWGFVTFTTTADAPSPDPREAVRDAAELLMPLYYAQRDVHAEHGRYATRTADLDRLPAPVRGRLSTASFLLYATPWSFTGLMYTADGTRWTVNEEGRLVRRTAP
ncbi:MAG TPA: carbohydrate-binding family 9-like protein [Candidatus Krumholzibacteria bacterium]|nr:carbohydrate-binding family 9-like protein [Candidatus Krumholzibacteria bacterium]HPD73102.1 carbohydrate-binding family 9-like protein [Candidatus Krumholzibacteria bacterium]HRY41902.1 carbohydrate-binding family 9-like protein [Candidatus Krumholzibacteria bacterium]